MEGIAAITGGRAFDGTRDPLDAIFKQSAATNKTHISVMSYG